MKNIEKIEKKVIITKIQQAFVTNNLLPATAAPDPKYFITQAIFVTCVNNSKYPKLLNVFHGTSIL